MSLRNRIKQASTAFGNKAIAQTSICISRGPTLRTEETKCCGTVEIFRCAKRRREVHHTKCKTCEFFIAKSSLLPCSRGDYLVWRINEQGHRQDKPYCRFWEDFISTSGQSCQDCAKQQMLNWRSRYMHNAFAGLISAQGREVASDVLIKAVADRRVKGSVALELGDAFQLNN